MFLRRGRTKYEANCLLNDESTGQAVQGNIYERACLRIDILGPGLPSADGYDWVRVEKLTQEQEMATSNFIITLKDADIEVRYAGRNELVNTNNASNWDNIRNFFVGITAKIGASYPQWKALVDGLCEPPPRD